MLRLLLGWMVRRVASALAFVALVRWLEVSTRPPLTGRCSTCPHRSPHREHRSNGHLRVVP